MTKETRSVTLPETIAEAKRLSIPLDEAARRLGVPSAEKAPIRDGFTMPPHRFVLTADAQTRAASHGVDRVMALLERELEENAIDEARTDPNKTGLDFIFLATPSPDGSYEDGYVMWPESDGMIHVDATKMRRRDEGGLTIMMPV